MGITTAIVMSLVIGATSAYMSYAETQAANERAVTAGINRNLAMEDSYNADQTASMITTERETSKMAYEKHRKREAIAASMASAGVGTSQGSAGIFSKDVGERYNMAAGRVGEDATRANRLGYQNLVAGQTSNWDAVLAAQRNPMFAAATAGFAATGSSMQIAGGIKSWGA
jgi:hypothetical protein